MGEKFSLFILRIFIPFFRGTESRQHFLHSFFLLAILFFAPCGNVTAQIHQSHPPIIKSLSLNGNHLLSERQILDAIAAKAGSAYSTNQINSDLASIAALYNSEGYYFADIRLAEAVFNADSTSVDLVILIQEGEKSLVGSIQIEGNSAFTTDEILSKFDTHTGEVLVTGVLERDIDGLITRYEKAGYPFASVKIEKIAPSSQDSAKKLDVGISISEGARVQINEIRVSGNTETREHVIVRETGFTPGEVYNSDKMANIRKRLNRLNIFTRVDEPELYVTGEGSGGLQLRVQEGNTNTFDGILGYVPGSGTSGDQGYFSGLVNVSMRNLFGTARKFSVLWQKDDRYSQELAFQYQEPWVFDYPVDLGVSFDQRQQDTTYIRRSIELTANIRIMDVFTVGGIFNNVAVIPSSSSAGSFLSSSSTTTTGLQLQYDSRDDIVSPTGGAYYKTDYRIGSKNITGGNGYTAGSQLSNSVKKISLDIQYYFQPLTRQVVAMTMHGRQITSDNIELSDLYRFGGATTLRGYKENQFLGSRVAWTNTEYRFITSFHSYFFGFFDTGYYFLPADTSRGTFESQHFKYGYGIGMRFETSLGNIGVSFALGEGDSFSQAKIHVGLINDF
jgi:outer membrane protein insertion porin family